MRWRGMAGATLVVLVGCVWAVATSSSAGAASHSVSIQYPYFTPQMITIAVGDSVTWTNNDQAMGYDHTVSGAGFNSSPACNTQTGVGCLQPGRSYTHTFNAAGSYDYHCNVHPNMMGTVVVQAAAPATTAPPTTKAAAPAPTTPTTHPAPTTTTTTTGPAATTTTAPATTTATRATTTSSASSVPSPTVQLAAPAGHHGSGSAAVAVGLGLAALATVGGIVALVQARRRSL